MTNQEIFEMLSEAESHIYEMWSRDHKNPELTDALASARSALVAFAKATGCHN